MGWEADSKEGGEMSPVERSSGHSRQGRATDQRYRGDSPKLSGLGILQMTIFNWIKVSFCLQKHHQNCVITNRIPLDVYTVYHTGINSCKLSEHW